nr:hypothetical protein [Lachnobacterium bovis]
MDENLVQANKIYDCTISDFPEPVVPATNPCGPCAFSCRFKETISSSARSPSGTARVLWD